MFRSISRRTSHGQGDGFCRILFNVIADEDNYNAQSLNAREIALRLDPAKFQSTMFFSTKPDPRLMRRGIRLVKLPSRQKTWVIFRELLGAHDFVVYIDFSPASYLYLHLPRWTRRSTKTVFCIEGSRGNMDGASKTLRRHANYVSRHAQIIVAISDFLAWDLDDARGLKSNFIIPVGVDTKLFSPPPIRGRATTTVLFVGHLIERKGPQLVLETARSFPEIRFRIVGLARDEFGRNLKRLSHPTMPANVSIEQPVPQEQLAKIMQQSDIFLLPSRIEGVPKVTLEAAATGLPCVVFDDYQTPSIVDGVTGFQVKTLDQMIDRLRILISDPSLREAMGAAAVKHAKLFDWDDIGRLWSDLFLRVQKTSDVSPPRNIRANASLPSKDCDSLK